MMLKLVTFAAMVLLALSPGVQSSDLDKLIEESVAKILGPAVTDVVTELKTTQTCGKPENAKVLQDLFGIDAWPTSAAHGSQKFGSFQKDLPIMKALYCELPPYGGYLISPSRNTVFVFTCSIGNWYLRSKDSLTTCRADTLVDQQQINWNRLAFGCIWIIGAISAAAGYHLTSEAHESRLHIVLQWIFAPIMICIGGCGLHDCPSSVYYRKFAVCCSIIAAVILVPIALTGYNSGVGLDSDTDVGLLVPGAGGIETGDHPVANPLDPEAMPLDSNGDADANYDGADSGSVGRGSPSYMATAILMLAMILVL
eukprot:938524_1